jgi:hypothetical protein
VITPPAGFQSPRAMGFLTCVFASVGGKQGKCRSAAKLTMYPARKYQRTVSCARCIKKTSEEKKKRKKRNWNLLEAHLLMLGIRD